MKDFIRQRLREEISASEGTTLTGSIQTLIDAKRDIAFAGSDMEQSHVDMINDAGNIGSIKIEGRANSFVLYRTDMEGAKENALKLKAIAEKYDGFLSWEASDEETIMIGRLLGYKESDIQDHIKKRNEPKKKSIFNRLQNI